MPKTLLLTFDDESQRDEFLDAMNVIIHTTTDPAGANMKHQAEGWEKRKENGEFLQKVMRTAKLDPPIKSDGERLCTLFVSGKKMLEGSLADLNKRFDQEVGVHSGSVEIREKRDDEWVVVRNRMRKQQ